MIESHPQNCEPQKSKLEAREPTPAQNWGRNRKEPGTGNFETLQCITSPTNLGQPLSCRAVSMAQCGVQYAMQPALPLCAAAAGLALYPTSLVLHEEQP